MLNCVVLSCARKDNQGDVTGRRSIDSESCLERKRQKEVQLELLRYGRDSCGGVVDCMCMYIICPKEEPSRIKRQLVAHSYSASY